ncbi:hypothetical protein CVT24_008274 [Panaeolus cyanescens]|uniref:Uncharacterized protein n=1 Tax=Panaeolus cyanescens TaxID=181874 RepID=A0A409YR35_9AGAR|nr:hypothetical protein CVT24_008274 [Panaeolus cyanescens]
MASKSSSKRKKGAVKGSPPSEIDDADNVSETAQESIPKKRLRRSNRHDVSIDGGVVEISKSDEVTNDDGEKHGENQIPTDRDALSHLLGSEEPKVASSARDNIAFPDHPKTQTASPTYFSTSPSVSLNRQDNGASALASPFPGSNAEVHAASQVSSPPPLPVSNIGPHANPAFLQDPFMFFAQWQMYDSMIRSAQASALSSPVSNQTNQASPSLALLGNIMGGFPYAGSAAFPFSPNPTTYLPTTPARNPVTSPGHVSLSSSNTSTPSNFRPSDPIAFSNSFRSPFQSEQPVFSNTPNTMASASPSLTMRSDDQVRDQTFGSNLQPQDQSGSSKSKGKEKETSSRSKVDLLPVVQSAAELSNTPNKNTTPEVIKKETKQSQWALLRKQPHTEKREKFMSIVPTRETKISDSPLFMSLSRILRLKYLTEVQTKSIKACDSMVAVGPYANLSRVKCSNITYSIPQFQLIWSDSNEQPVVGIMLGAVVKCSIMSPHLHSANPQYNQSSQYQRRISIVPTLTSYKSFRSFLAEVFPKLQSLKLQLECGTDIVFTSHRENTKWRGEGESKLGVALFERGSDDSDEEGDAEADAGDVGRGQEWFFERYRAFRDYEDGVPIYDCRQFGFMFDEESFAHLKELPKLDEDVPTGSIVAIGFTPNLFKADHIQNSPSKKSAAASSSDPASGSVEEGEDEDLKPSSTYCLSLNAQFVTVLSSPA